MLECPKTAQMKDFLKLYQTVMDFKGLSFIVTEQPFNKQLCPVFYFATVTTVKITNHKLPNAIIKIDILAKAKMLKGNEKWKGVSITHDLTKMQCAEEKTNELLL